MQLRSWSAEQPSFSLSSMVAARVREAKESKTKSRDIMVVFILIVLCSLEELGSMMQGFSGDFLYPSCSQVTRGRRVTEMQKPAISSELSRCWEF